MDEETRKLIFHVYTLIHQTAHGISRLREDELLQGGSITGSRIAIMMVAEYLGNKATPAEISRWLFRQPHSVSIITDKMEKDGVIKKVGDLARKNQIRIEITDKGYEILDHMPERKVLKKILSCLSTNELICFVDYLERIWNNTIKEMGIKQRPPFPTIELMTRNYHKAGRKKVPKDRKHKISSRH